MKGIETKISEKTSILIASITDNFFAGKLGQKRNLKFFEIPLIE